MYNKSHHSQHINVLLGRRYAAPMCLTLCDFTSGDRVKVLSQVKMNEIKRPKAIEFYQSHPELKYWFLLRKFVFSIHYEAAKTLLDEHASLQSMRNFLGETVLHFLAIENDMEGVAWLFQSGFDLDVKDRFGRPLIFSIASLGYVDLLVWFKVNGADFNVTNNAGHDIYEYIKIENKVELLSIIKQQIT